MNLSKMFKKAGHKIKGLYAFNLITGKISVSDSCGNFYEVDKQTGELTDVTDFVKALSGEAVGIPVEINTIKIGDVIDHAGGAAIVIGTKPLKVFSEEGSSEEVVQIKSILNMGNFVIKYMHPLISMLDSDGQNIFGNLNSNSDNGMGSMMMMMMLKDDKGDSTNNSMMEMLFLSQMIGGNNFTDGQNGINPMMLMAFMGDDDDDGSDMMEMILMSQMFNQIPKTESENRIRRFDKR